MLHFSLKLLIDPLHLAHLQVTQQIRQRSTTLYQQTPYSIFAVESKSRKRKSGARNEEVEQFYDIIRLVGGKRLKLIKEKTGRGFLPRKLHVFLGLFCVSLD